MLRIAFISDAPQVAGSEIWLKEVLPRLKAFGLETFLILPSRPSLERFAKEMENKGVPVRTYTRLDSVLNLAQEANLRVVQAWSSSTYRYLLPRLGHPTWVFVHDQLQYHYPLGFEVLYREIYRQTKAKAIRAANLILTGTYWAATYLQKEFGLQAETVPVGVNLAIFRPPTPEERAHLRAKHRLENFSLITPARFALEKNHSVILKTARLVPEATFLLVGKGSLARPLQALARVWKLKNIRFLGYQEETALLYRASDALLFPTLADNPGLVILEAMASGLPVITSPFPPQAEVVSPKEGYLVPPQPRYLAKAIRELMANPLKAQALGTRGYLRVKAERPIEKTVHHLAKLILERSGIK